MIRPLLAALLLALPANAQERPPAGRELRVPECRKGEAMPEGDLFALLEKGAGEKIELMHNAGPEGHLIFTYNAKSGTWSEILADGGLACLLRYGRDKDTPA